MAVKRTSRFIGTRNYLLVTTSMLYSKYQEYYYVLLISNLKTHYLCSQKVEEEIGSAGEQPMSNKLSALYSKCEGDGILLSLFSLYWYRFYGLRKPNLIHFPAK